MFGFRFERGESITRGALALSLMLSLSMVLAACSGSSSSSAGDSEVQESEASEVVNEESGPQDADSSADADAAPEQPAEFDNWTSSSTDNPVNWKWGVKKVGSFKGNKSDVKVSRYGVPFDSEEKHVFATDGSLIMDGAEIDSEKSFAIVADRTLYSVAAAGEDPNCYGLVEADGEVLIECEAATFQGFANAYGQMRFLGVWYVGDEVSEPTRANLEIDGTSYEAKGRIYDLEECAFVDGIELNSAKCELFNLGDCFAVKDKDFDGTSDGKTTLYDANGTVVWSFDGTTLVDVGPDYLVFSNHPHEGIVDTTGTVTFTAGDGDIISTIRSEGGGGTGFPWSPFLAYKKSGEDGYAIIDKYGNQAVPGTYRIVYNEADGLFGVGTSVDSDDTALINMDGEQLANEGSMLRRMVPGYTRLVSDIYHGSQKIAKSSELNIRVDGGYMVLSTGETLPMDRSDGLDVGLVAGMGPNDAYYGVWDLFTGQQVIDASYESVVAAGACSYADGNCYLFAFGQGEWTVYEAYRTQA